MESTQTSPRILLPLFLALALCASPSGAAAASRAVEVRRNQLFVDGKAQPELFGAELQYFRLRGGEGPNVPREKVIALWNRALDQMVAAGMNAVSFYIPWDFHEYAEGKFDFTGTADEDGDGNPDYPSRDLFTFFRLIEEHGIHRIMVRPGPYVNAEWGFLGFGAIPLWFHEKYPDSHMRSPEGLRTKLYDYHDPDLLAHTRLWFKALHEQVLRHYIGPGKPVIFVQLDNETNFMWQSIFDHDYGARAIARYRGFLEGRYRDLATVNRIHQRDWRSWDEVQPPTVPGVNIAEDQDWYRFQDESIHSYLEVVRQDWEELGVREPEVLFTLAESYNAMPNGLLPNFRYRNDPGRTGIMTTNLYPKTYEAPNHSLLNLPFKTDHDVKAVSAANAYYWGRPEQWAMGPEIQAGWWKGTEVTDASRKQTYLSAIGHGLKAFFLYYFTEGDNWESGWARKQIQPLFDTLKQERSVADDDAFWEELQRRVDRQVLVGFDARGILGTSAETAAKLYFDAPLDGSANPRAGHMDLLSALGKQVIAPHRRFLARATEVTDPVVFVKDVGSQMPSLVPGVDGLELNSDWSAGLLGWFLQGGINPSIHHWGLNPASELDSARLIVYQDNGAVPADLAGALSRSLARGATVVSLLGDSLARSLGYAAGKPEGTVGTDPKRVEVVTEDGERFSAAGRPLFTYAPNSCKPILMLHEAGSPIVGYRCATAGKGAFIQIGALAYDEINSDQYSFLGDMPQRLRFLKEQLLTPSGVRPRLEIIEDGKKSGKEGGDRIVAFARQDPGRTGLWVTIKNSRPVAIAAHLRIAASLLPKTAGEAHRELHATDLFAPASAPSNALRPEQIAGEGVPLRLDAYDSTVVFISR